RKVRWTGWSGAFLTNLGRPKPSGLLLRCLRRQALTPLGGAMRGPGLHQVDRERKHDRRAALASNIEQCREITQLHRLWHRRQYLRGVDQLVRRLVLCFGVYDLGAARAFGLRLTRDRSYHALVEIDALDLDGGHLDAPCLGLFIEHVLDIRIEFVALGQHLVEVVLSQDPA